MNPRLVTAVPLVVALLGSIGMVAFASPPTPAAPSVRLNMCRKDHPPLLGRKGEFWATAARQPSARHRVWSRCR